MSKVTFNTLEGVPVEIDTKKVTLVAEGNNDQSARIYTDTGDVTVLGSVVEVSAKLGLIEVAPEEPVVDFTAEANVDETAKLMPHTAPVNPTPIATEDEEGTAKEQAAVQAASEAEAQAAADEAAKAAEKKATEAAAKKAAKADKADAAEPVAKDDEAK